MKRKLIPVAPPPMPTSEAWHLVELGAVDSTNTVASKLVLSRYEKSEPAGRIAVLASKQRSGRGQHGRVWESPEGGLYLSASAEGMPAGVRDRLALAAGVAVAHALGDLGIKGVGVRWPNDVMIGTRKVGGILCEAVALGERFAAIVGIGVNVNTPMEALPEAVRGTATSLLAQDGVPRDIKAVAHAVLARLGVTLDVLRREGLGPVLAELRGLDVLRDQRVTVVEGREEIVGIGAGVNPQGELVVRVGDEFRAVRGGTVMSVGGVGVRGIQVTGGT